MTYIRIKDRIIRIDGADHIQMNKEDKIITASSQESPRL